uniref:Putative secreted protein n=1 Tax=Ixodes ricinus TaxID=34613 RepID=A0A6B0UIM4_IXORI
MILLAILRFLLWTSGPRRADSGDWFLSSVQESDRVLWAILSSVPRTLLVKLMFSAGGRRCLCDWLLPRRSSTKFRMLANAVMSLASSLKERSRSSLAADAELTIS